MASAPRTKPTLTADQVKALAQDHGFDVCGLADARAPWEAGARLQAFVDAGHHGSMDWMETTLARRSHPTAMWAGARSAIMLGVNYGPDTDPMEALTKPDKAVLSVYAGGDDYHDVIKKKLKAMAGELHRLTGAEVKVFVDTAPLMEKPLAALAGLGWQGKHTNLVSKDYGSWLFLGAILTDLPLAPDQPSLDHCGRCTACLDACPTEAFPAPYQLDARRCISYLTIEHDGPIPRAFRKPMGNRIYGCDDCLAVCPWNKFAQTGKEVRLALRDTLRDLSLSDLAFLDDAAFRTLFAKNPIKRIGVARFLRNVAIGLGNSGQASHVPAARHLSQHENPLVRGAGVWALQQLLPAGDFSALAKTSMAQEENASVRAEWGQTQ
ncbi:epoxyqueuosine reductase [Candidatus Phycosocius bacilliformis]|uniref:Epoxyqueuosine reductase n=1 Tax=Candidatus Phycosocius bacilliformis TaxID=1445552 RepID=A0A2P2EC45_9PROT|nr:tRNA epoxyqueuosine(34) reductase QueG [Candidatus Phycosocius bacilliformis]GBF58632.1 epoxyqueuosine reductase [Candidatus Phycosocius bacilliformis]